MKVNRDMDVIHQKFILDCAKSSIGATHAYKLLKELLGGEYGVGCTLTEVRNFARDTKCYVDGVDAQMLIDDLKRRKESCEGFTYAYEVDAQDKLKRVFWCDAISKKNYRMFGEIVAFDTTYSTNKYCMIFAPFTGQDNHGKAVTFGAGLLNKEDAESFIWLFEQFVSCVGKAPRMIVTDQDLGMKVAVGDVLRGTRHRWCMWHIMLKLPDKISKQLRADEDFKKELNGCVWSDMLEPDEFDNAWKDIMSNYGLIDHEWFVSMFENRKFWVPAYFRDCSFGGMLRTTSISECENIFYKRYTRSRSNLMKFFMQYNNALESQRHANLRLNYRDKYDVPEFKTNIALEKHAASVYTAYVFEKVKSEIADAYFGCRIEDIRVDDNMETFRLGDYYDRVVEVTYDSQDEAYQCSCKLFGMTGILCCHIFFILKNKGISYIPDRYVCTRWKKTHLLILDHHIKPDELDVFVALDESRRLSNNVLSAVYRYMHMFDGDCDKMTKFIAIIEEGGDVIIGGRELNAAIEKNKLIAHFYETPLPDQVDISPPDVVKTKGSGSRKISKKEARIHEFNKPKRTCKKYGELGYHDSRNCDKMRSQRN